MKIKIGLSDAERFARYEARNVKRKAREHWHKVYVIFPRRFEDGTYHFLEHVERKKGIIIKLHKNNVWGWLYHERDRMSPQERYMTAQPAVDHDA